MTKSERHDYAMFIFNFLAVGLNVWGMTINAFWYVFKGDALSIIWLMLNLLAIALCASGGLRSLRLRHVSRLLDLTEAAVIEAIYKPTPENAQRVIDLHRQTSAVVAKFFPEWDK